MKVKLIAVASLAMSLAAGAALAQGAGTSASGQDSAPTGAIKAPNDDSVRWDDPGLVGGLYTDDSMKTMRTGDDFRSAFMKMDESKRTAMTEQCKNLPNDASPRAQELCGTLNKM